jgi:hypothetical protein
MPTFMHETSHLLELPVGQEPRLSLDIPRVLTIFKTGSQQLVPHNLGSLFLKCPITRAWHFLFNIFKSLTLANWNISN